MRTTAAAVLVIPFVSALTACAVTAPTKPPTREPAEPEAALSTGEVDCVGGSWSLDVADYGSQAAVYLEGLGIPIHDFAMTGAGKITFTPDGLVTTEIDLLSTGTIVAGDVSVSVSVPSAYTGSGDWRSGANESVIDLANWATVIDPGTIVNPDAPQIPVVDYTDIPEISADCTSDTLLLHVPDAPLSTLWHR